MSDATAESCRALLPAITVCIPMCNEVESVERVVDTVFRSTLWQLAERKELLICVNGSSDGTQAKAEDVARRHPQVTVFVNPRKGKNLAWETLVARSSHDSDVLFFLDADVLLDPSALDELYQVLLERPDVDIVGGSAYPLPEKYAHYDAFQRLVARHGYLPRIRELRGDTTAIRGACYAIRPPVARTIAMPADQRISDDEFLTYLLAGRSTVCLTALAYYLPANFRDRICQRTRHMVSTQLLRAQYPELVAEWRRRYGRSLATKAMAFIELPLDAQVVVLLNRLADVLARVDCKRKLRRGTDTWNKIRSSKLVARPTAA